MPMKFWKPLHPRIELDIVEDEEEEEGGEYLFDPEAGRASDDPFAHLASKDAPDSAASEDTVSKYVAGEEE
jgi:hypothetical protein|tara:strand:- start:18 stop:230 length:213 start_codon:yes stop_codon:yes gene_type:complete